MCPVQFLEWYLTQTKSLRGGNVVGLSQEEPDAGNLAGGSVEDSHYFRVILSQLAFNLWQRAR